MNELGNTPADKNYKPSGISKAEERAMEIYPDMTFPFTPLDLNAYRRGAFITGYKAAEKDMEERFIRFVHSHYPINYIGWIKDFQRAMEDEK